MRKRRSSASKRKPNQCGCPDFILDQRAAGRRFHILDIVDDVTRGRLRALLDTSNVELAWAGNAGVQWHDIALGKSTQNGCVERFHGRMRDYFNETLLSLAAFRRSVACQHWPTAAPLFQASGRYIPGV